MLRTCPRHVVLVAHANPRHLVQMYNFTSFAVTLNELEPGMERLLAPTDCRQRPDIRAMESGDLGSIRLQHLASCGFSSVVLTLCTYTDTASAEKERLEEKQRAARRKRSKDEKKWSTRYRTVCTVLRGCP